MQNISYKRPLLGPGPEITMTVRVSDTNVVYYALPTNAVLIQEDVEIQGTVNYHMGRIAEELNNNLPLPIGYTTQMAQTIIGSATTPPIGHTTTMSYIEQNGKAYNAVFETFGGEVIGLKGWRTYSFSSFFDFRVPYGIK